MKLTTGIRSSTFLNWTNLKNPSDALECASGSVTMNADKACTANFSLNTYTLTLDKKGTGSGTVTGAGTYSYNQTATVSAAANPGSTFAGWSDINADECTRGSVLMTANKKCTATFNLTPTLLSIAVTTVSPAIFVGASEPFTATARYSDNSTRDVTASAVWSSSKPSIATITAAGVATGVSKGSTTIVAVIGSVKGSTSLSVSAVVLQAITVAPLTATVHVNGSHQFTATGHYNDGSLKDLTSTASWSPPPPKSTIATVSASGLATGVKPGTVKIIAKVGSLTGSATLTVTP